MRNCVFVHSSRISHLLNQCSENVVVGASRKDKPLDTHIEQTYLHFNEDVQPPKKYSKQHIDLTEIHPKYKIGFKKSNISN